MKLKVKYVNLSTGGPIVSVINEEDAKKLDLYALDRVKIKRLKTEKEIVAVVDISTRGVRPGEIGLFDETIKKLDIPEGTHVEVEETERPKSLDLIRKKLDGAPLTKEEMDTIVEDVLENNLSEPEITYFISGAYTRGMNLQEATYLTQAIVDRSYRIKLDRKIVLDKHCAGGVPGNRTTMVIVPIIAALGYTMPKTSSRSITSASGTADTMEVLAPVCLSHEKIIKTIKETNACMIWEAALNPMGVDELFIKIRHPLSLDPEGLLLSSVMAKKKSVGATHVLIDLPFGEGAKFTYKSAKILRMKFIKIGKQLGIKVKVILTDGSQPIGNGVGPVWEARDVLTVLQGAGPNDLRDKSIMMATILLKMAGLKNAEGKVIEAIDSGAAYQKMLEIIQAQGGSKNIKLPKPKYFHQIMSKKAGTVIKIDNKLIAKIARIAGAPKDKAAGLYLRVHKGIRVRKGKELFTIYAENKKKLEYAKKIAEHHEAIHVS
ncbi:MAG: thymidine phosphorylase [archaeon]